MSFLSDSEWHHVPMRLDAARWATWRSTKRVLIVVHTVTTGQRLLEVARLLEGDPRVQIVFTMAPDVFSNGVAEFLDGLKAVVLPWRQAVQTAFNLALASGHEGLHELHAPVVVLPHGAGHNKLIAGGRSARAVADRGVYGLSRQWLVRDGAVVPDTIVLAHREDLVRLGRHCPEALPVAEVVGDPCYDRIKASTPLRALYRTAMGVESRQRLVVVSSTWGPNSLMARSPRLIQRLVRELPRHDCRPALLLHPNAWNAHGEWQIRTWLADLRRAGLALVSQHADWTGVLVAADYIVSDHGSMALYGTATGVPVLMDGCPEADVDPGSPVAELSLFAHRINQSQPVRRQLARSLAEYRQEDYARVAGRITSEPGRFGVHMRALLYRKLRLRAPSGHPDTQTARRPELVRECDDGIGAL
ncbi:hypothetical protein [Streptomyces albus]|uniref:hypothetical protein n=1 Tax=Streptomyces albus TaxID=1888 RepID=UPI0004CA018E|nr:hypothetical protein [Streptomyces albus]